MPPRFDPDLLRVELSVADLLERELVGSLSFNQRGGYERLWLGQAIHSRYQEEALEEDPTYQRELGVLLALDHRGWKVRIHGRIDGLRRDGEARVVEEIKSVRRGGQLSPTTREIYQRQALLYAWMLRQLQPGGEVRAELVLIEIGGDEVVREPLEADFDLLEASVRRRLNSLIRAFDAEHAAIFSRRAASPT
jgi:hypothetical protein